MKMAHRITLSCALGAALLLGAFVLHQYPPGTLPFYPQCYLYRLTGLYCPGCGGTRCVSALLHLEPAEAWRKNALVFLMLPFLGLWAARSWWHWMNPGPPESPKAVSPLKSRLLITLVVIVLAFGILRNLPWEPFRLLAPR